MKRSTSEEKVVYWFTKRTSEEECISEIKIVFTSNETNDSTFSLQQVIRECFMTQFQKNYNKALFI